jgi:hypothetical protein
MIRVYQCVRYSAAPWCVGERVVYRPFEYQECVTIIGHDGNRSFGLAVIPTVHRDAFTGSLELIHEHVEDADIVDLFVRECGGH